MQPAGYSATPLAKKLGIKEGFTLKLVNQPPYYLDLFDSLPEGIQQIDDSTVKKDFIHYFAKRESQLRKDIAGLRQEIKENGMIWISWPKKSAKLDTDLDGNLVRLIGLQHKLVDVKVCAVDQTWSGLKFVIRVEDRKIRAAKH